MKDAAHSAAWALICCSHFLRAVENIAIAPIPSKQTSKMIWSSFEGPDTVRAQAIAAAKTKAAPAMPKTPRVVNTGLTTESARDLDGSEVAPCLG